jgi:aspartate aminotransferase
MTLRPSRRVADLERTMIREIFDAAPPDALNLGLGQPDLATPDVAALGGVGAIAHRRTGYTSTAGDLRLREALAERYAGIVAGPDEVLVTIGSQEAMFASCLALLDPGDELLYPDPGYPAYPQVARLVGARGVPYPLRAERAFRLDPADVASRLSERTRAVILCTPSNPTGAGIDDEALASLVGLLRERGVAWISDEIYSAFYWKGTFRSPAEIDPAGGLVVSSLSKDLAMTGWRIGWVLGEAELMRRIVATHQYIVTCASSVSQQAALACFGAAGERARAAYVARFRARREVMAEALEKIPGLEVRRPDGAFYFFVDVSRFGDSVQICRRILRRQGVIVIPGEAFGGGGKGFVRVSFAASRKTIREGVRRIADELEAQ